jgi:hypothetical protein
MTPMWSCLDLHKHPPCSNNPELVIHTFRFEYVKELREAIIGELDEMQKNGEISETVRLQAIQDLFTAPKMVSAVLGKETVQATLTGDAATCLQNIISTRYSQSLSRNHGAAAAAPQFLLSRPSP